MKPECSVVRGEVEWWGGFVLVGLLGVEFGGLGTGGLPMRATTRVRVRLRVGVGVGVGVGVRVKVRVKVRVRVRVRLGA